MKNIVLGITGASGAAEAKKIAGIPLKEGMQKKA